MAGKDFFPEKGRSLMEKKLKYLWNRYRNLCIVTGVAGFILAPFMWPLFLAIFANTLSLTVPVVMVYLLVKQPWKKKEEVKDEKCKKEQYDAPTQKPQENPAAQKKPDPGTKATQEQKAPESQKKPTMEKKEKNVGKDSEKRADSVKVDKDVTSWFSEEGRERIRHIAKKLEGENIYSFSIGKDGMCCIKAENGYKRVAGIRDFPGKKLQDICTCVNQDGEFQARLSGKYLWIIQKRRHA